MLSPTLVGDIAHGEVSLAGLSGDEVRSVARHQLSYALCEAVGDDPDFVRVPEVVHATAGRQVVRSLAVAASASRVTEILSSAGIRCITYKGPALAVQTTGSWRGRGSADVDVLIDPADLDASDRALRAAGCWSRTGEMTPPNRWERYHHPERAYSGLPATIDLHWRVDAGPGYFAAPFDEVWARREHVAVDGLDVQTFDRVDAFMATAAHGAKERWWRWFWALDAVRQVELLDAALWPTVFERARSMGTRHAVGLCLAVAAVCGARMPNRVTATTQMMDIATSWLALSSGATNVEWSNSAAFSRRRARWIIADSPFVAADGFARAVGRLIAERRAPGAPQHPNWLDDEGGDAEAQHRG